MYPLYFGTQPLGDDDEDDAHYDADHVVNDGGEDVDGVDNDGEWMHGDGVSHAGGYPPTRFHAQWKITGGVGPHGNWTPRKSSKLNLGSIPQGFPVTKMPARTWGTHWGTKTLFCLRF